MTSGGYVRGDSAGFAQLCSSLSGLFFVPFLPLLIGGCVELANGHHDSEAHNLFGSGLIGCIVTLLASFVPLISSRASSTGRPARGQAPPIVPARYAPPSELR